MTDQQAGDNLQSVHILAAAQRQADQLLAEARAAAAQVTADAETRRDKLLAEARAAQVLAQAIEDADHLIEQARAKAPLDAQARLSYFGALGDAFGTQLAALLAGLEEAGHD